MAPNERLLIEHACGRLSLEFARLNDSRQYELLAQLFTADAVLQRPLAPQAPLRGREAILRAMQLKPATEVAHHVCTNILVDVVAPDRATGLTYFTVYVHAAGRGTDGVQRFDGSVYIGAYHDEFVLTEEGWRILERIGSVKFVLPPAAARHG